MKWHLVCQLVALVAGAMCRCDPSLEPAGYRCYGDGDVKTAYCPPLHNCLAPGLWNRPEGGGGDWSRICQATVATSTTATTTTTTTTAPAITCRCDSPWSASPHNGYSCSDASKSSSCSATQTCGGSNWDLPNSDGGAWSAICVEQSMSDWPIFNSAGRLLRDPWGEYFQQLYMPGKVGVLPPFSYPLRVGEFWQFYADLVPEKRVPKSVGECPSHGATEGQRYERNNAYQPAKTFFSWHGPPYAAVPGKTWIEVSHQADPFGDEHFGMWLLYAKGSGVWFNTGRTVAFKDHGNACRPAPTATCPHCRLPCVDWDGNERMSIAAKHAGYDSVQFTEHHDHVNYPCDGRAGVPYMGLEIVAVQIAGTSACGDAAGAHFRAGWQGSEPCNCVESKGVLNCGGNWHLNDPQAQSNHTAVATALGMDRVASSVV